MLSRLFLALVTLFFLTMNLLLWRFEISGRGKLGSPVPVEMVWHKVLTAPDNSAMEIRHRGRRIGYCRWSPNVGEALAAELAENAPLPPEGMVRRIADYRIDFDGGVFLSGMGHVRFNCNLQLSTNHLWRNIHLRLNIKPAIYEIDASAEKETVQVRVQEPAGRRWIRTFRFDEFRNPEQLLASLGNPMVLELLQAAGLPSFPGAARPAGLPLGLSWEARRDSMPMGRIRIQVYRLEARLMDRFQAVAMVSRVGEILQVTVPGETVLVNDAFLHL